MRAELCQNSNIQPNNVCKSFTIIYTRKYPYKKYPQSISNIGKYDAL